MFYARSWLLLFASLELHKVGALLLASKCSYWTRRIWEKVCSHTAMLTFFCPYFMELKEHEGFLLFIAKCFDLRWCHFLVDSLSSFVTFLKLDLDKNGQKRSQSFCFFHDWILQGSRALRTARLLCWAEKRKRETPVTPFGSFVCILYVLFQSCSDSVFSSVNALEKVTWLTTIAYSLHDSRVSKNLSPETKGRYIYLSG